MRKGKKFHFSQQNISWGTTALAVICLSIVFYLLLTKLPAIRSGLSVIAGVIMPVIIGCGIAYLLLPVYNALYRLTEPRIAKSMTQKRAVKFSKGLSTFLSLLFFIAIIVLLLVMAIPQVVDSIMNIAYSMPDNIDKMTQTAQKLLADYPDVAGRAVDFLNNLETNFMSLFRQYLLPYMNDILSGITESVISAVSVFFNILVGLIVCVYILVSKETFCAQAKKFVYSRMEVEKANSLIDDVRSIHRIFSGFISGKIIDSLIIGLITVVVLNIMNMPYAVMISVIVGVTNIIPFFGPFIGAIPSALIILTSSPLQSLYFLIYVLIIQQIDGNVIGPKILGNTTGLPSFWVLFAILLCGGLFGIVGMILGVPLFATLYLFIGRAVNNSLRRRGFGTDTRLYYGLQDVSDESGEKIMNYMAEPGKAAAEKKADQKDKVSGKGADEDGGKGKEHE